MPGVPLLLVAGAFAFGLVDDAYGDGGSRGFRGHLGALRRNGLTTGGLKLFGIGALSLTAGAGAAFSISRLTFSGGASPQPGWLVVSSLCAWVVAALTIALSANLVNLADLRPGRALKLYALLVGLGALAAAWRLWRTYSGASSVAGIAPGAPLTAGVGALLLLVLLMGPAAVVWRADLGERGMLGDAGANAMGALAGYVLVSSLPLWLATILAAVLLALNLSSERVSFSRVIEQRPLLRWIDGLGRSDALASADRSADTAGIVLEEGDGPMEAEAHATDGEHGKDGGS
jgi:hypothetical protein